MARIRRIDCSEPGIGRIRCGRGFRYVDPQGRWIADPGVVERIQELAIPPAWTDVWICTDPQGHIQATGTDAAGRKQYLYHPRWRARRDQEKFDRMLDFAAALPAMRRRVEEDLGRRGLVRERVLACAVRLLDLGFFRIGGEEYADGNGTYGLATLKKRHLRFERGEAMFDYRGKNSQRYRQTVRDPLVLPTLRALKRRRGGGSELLAYWQGRRWVDVRSGEINEHLKGVLGPEFSAKDFRTWNATMLAAVALARMDGQPPLSKTARKRIVGAAVKEVAGYLGNTPTVARNSYIDPRVVDRFSSGETVRRALARSGTGSNPDEFGDRQRIESAVRRLLG